MSLNVSGYNHHAHCYGTGHCICWNILGTMHWILICVSNLFYLIYLFLKIAGWDPVCWFYYSLCRTCTLKNIALLKLTHLVWEAELRTPCGWWWPRMMPSLFWHGEGGCSLCASPHTSHQSLQSCCTYVSWVQSLLFCSEKRLVGEMDLHDG